LTKIASDKTSKAEVDKLAELQAAKVEATRLAKVAEDRLAALASAPIQTANGSALANYLNAASNIRH
jgi:hypothetical protein